MQSTGNLESLPPGTGSDGPAAPANPADPRYISVKDTADVLGVSRLTVYRRFHSGLFPGRKLGRKIDISAPFVEALDAEIRSGRHVDVEQFAGAWNVSRLAAAS
jgi:excisionase family DNA binding protein